MLFMAIYHLILDCNFPKINTKNIEDLSRILLFKKKLREVFIGKILYRCYPEVKELFPVPMIDMSCHSIPQGRFFPVRENTGFFLAMFFRIQSMKSGSVKSPRK